MAWRTQDDVTSGTGTTTAAALVNPWSGNPVRAVFSMAFSANPGTVVAPAEWGAYTTFTSSAPGGLYLVTITAEDDFPSAAFGTTYTFTWDNSVSYVGGIYAISTLPVVNAFLVDINTLEDEQTGAGGPTNWLLPDMTATFAEAEEASAGCGVHVISPRAYLRTAGAGTFSTFASTGNWTYEGGFSTGSGLLGWSVNHFVRTNEASSAVGQRGLTWTSTASGVGVEQLIKVGRVTDTPLDSVEASPAAYMLQSRRIEARELPYELTSEMAWEADI